MIEIAITQDCGKFITHIAKYDNDVLSFEILQNGVMTVRAKGRVIETLKVANAELLTDIPYVTDKTPLTVEFGFPVRSGTRVTIISTKA